MHLCADITDAYGSSIIDACFIYSARSRRTSAPSTPPRVPTDLQAPTSDLEATYHAALPGIALLWSLPMQRNPYHPAVRMATPQYPDFCEVLVSVGPQPTQTPTQLANHRSNAHACIYSAQYRYLHRAYHTTIRQYRLTSILPGSSVEEALYRLSTNIPVVPKSLVISSCSALSSTYISIISFIIAITYTYLPYSIYSWYIRQENDSKTPADVLLSTLVFDCKRRK